LSDHNHIGHEHNRNNSKRGLMIAFFITAGIMVLEFTGGLMSNSLALLSDSGHMLSDASSLALSLAAVWLAARPASPNKTYGYYRFEILAALLNGVTLLLIAVFICWEAYQRFLHPPTIASNLMIGIAVIGLLANLSSAFALSRGGNIESNLNIRSAYVHVIGDALGSIAAIIAGILMYLFSWYIADPIVSILVALLIIKSALEIVNDTLHILLEGTPETVDFASVQGLMLAIPGVLNIHDLHIWTITSGWDLLTCHLLVAEDVDEQAVLLQAVESILNKYSIEHTTIQIEKSPACAISHCAPTEWNNQDHQLL